MFAGDASFQLVQVYISLGLVSTDQLLYNVGYGQEEELLRRGRGRRALLLFCHHSLISNVISTRYFLPSLNGIKYIEKRVVASRNHRFAGRFTQFFPSTTFLPKAKK